MKFNPEAGKAEVRRAITPNFPVTLEAHEEPKTFAFIDESGLSWGSVQVVTGSYEVGAASWFYAKAIVTKTDGNIDEPEVLLPPT